MVKEYTIPSLFGFNRISRIIVDTPVSMLILMPVCTCASVMPLLSVCPLLVLFCPLGIKPKIRYVNVSDLLSSQPLKTALKTVSTTETTANLSTEYAFTAVDTTAVETTAVDTTAAADVDDDHNDGGEDAAHKPLAFIRSQRGAPLLVNAGFVYRCERKSATRTYWLCVGYKRFKCNARIICEGNRHVKRTTHYSHMAETDRLEKASQLEYHRLDGDDRDEFLNSVHK